MGSKNGPQKYKMIQLVVQEGTMLMVLHWSFTCDIHVYVLALVFGSGFINNFVGTLRKSKIQRAWRVGA